MVGRLVSDTKKFDRGLTHLMHVDLHWLDVPERVKYKLVSIVHNCLHQKAPQYLSECCIPISDVASRRHLRSASRHHLVLPRHNLSTYGRRAFAVAGPAAWNSLSIQRLALSVSDVYSRLVCFQSTSTSSALEYALYKFTIYLLTYLLP